MIKHLASNKHGLLSDRAVCQFMLSSLANWFSWENFTAIGGKHGRRKHFGEVFGNNSRFYTEGNMFYIFYSECNKF